MAHNEYTTEERRWAISEMAEDLLDLRTLTIHRRLFEPQNPYANLGALPGQSDFISPQKAAAVLRNLAETGQVDWSTQIKEEKHEKTSRP